MKKLYLLLMVLFLAAFASSAFSQANSGELKAGSFGVTFSMRDTMSAYLVDNMSGNVFNSETFKTYGIGASYFVLNKLAVEPSLFVMKSDKNEKNNLTGKEEVDKIFIVSPSAGIYYYSRIKNGLYLYTGPCLSYLYYKLEEESTSTGKTKYNVFQISAVLGFKYMFNDTIGIFLNYGIGYSYFEGEKKVYDSSGTLTSDNEYTGKSGKVSNIDLGIACYF